MKSIKDLMSASVYDDGTDMPERTLWLAVIDRAMADFILGGKIDAGARKGCTWFLFANELEPFNLAYLCNMLFEDSDTALNNIRKRVIEASEKSGGWNEETGYVRRRHNRPSRLH